MQVQVRTALPGHQQRRQWQPGCTQATGTPDQQRRLARQSRAPCISNSSRHLGNLCVGQQRRWPLGRGVAAHAQITIGDLAAASQQASRQQQQAVSEEEEEEDEDEDEDEEAGEEQDEQAAAQQEKEDEEKQQQQQQKQQQQGQKQQAAAAQDDRKQQPAPPAAQQGKPSSAAATSALASSSEAVLVAGQAKLAPEDDLVTQEYTEEVEITIKPFTVQGAAEDTVAWVRGTNLGKAFVVALGGVLVGTLALACVRYWQKYQSPTNQRKRQLNRNKYLVDELAKVLPANRAKLTPGFVKGLKLRTGFTLVEVFRKYLWYLLRERTFDQGAVDDLVALKHAAGLRDEEIAEALRERSQRVYERYGSLMLNTDGMTEGGVQRKATCQALFRKLLYLTEHEPLVRPDSAAVTDLRMVFGATEDDLARLRIVTLHDVDLEKAFGLTVSVDDDDEAPAGGSSKKQQ